ncbi:hypothetical protein MANES_04G035800v8 [Manihot esculenta]|uniref:Uncharacterized protein n=1 Tax=Manihot esculenta TaxID=3983 RepID=A0ACB7HS67_MANES|nr:hypothetical protein MANES_04G035800v8 [Manihot esculenta]
MMENKRSPCSVDQGSLTSIATKRHKSDLSISPKERKEKLGERIVALQQLVSPYGKTDTASVLLEAMEYIQFLHEQVKFALISRPCTYGVVSGAECSIPAKYTGSSITGIRAIQSENQRSLPCSNLVHCWSCSQQWRRSLGPHQDHFSQI